MSTVKKSVLIIGLGNVGVGYDASDSSKAKVLSHARAFSSHPSFRLVGGVDPDLCRRQRFETIFKVSAFADTQRAVIELSPDLVVVATPTPLHLATVKSIFNAGKPKAVLCEKPLAYDLGEAEQIVATCAKQDCPLFVNFFRQSEPGVSEIRARLADGRIGTPIKGVVWYSKGIFNSGVHFLNLLHNLLGEVKSITRINSGRLWQSSDPEPDLEFVFDSGRAVFLAACEENFFHNSMELIAPNGRLRYDMGGAQITWQGIGGDLRFKGYISLNQVCDNISTDFDRIQWYVAEQLAASLEGRPAQICSGSEALRTQEILDQIKGIL